MDLLHATPRDAEGNLLGPGPSKVELHFHGPVTLNMIMPGLNQGAEDASNQLEAGGGVLGPLSCVEETQAMLPTHPNNTPKSRQWRMDEHPYYKNYVEAMEPDADDEDDDEPEDDEPAAAEVEDETKGRWSWIPGRRSSRVAAE